jgi:hypothetical protein
MVREETEMATGSKSPYFRPAQEGGPIGRGATSPLGGRSYPDANNLQLHEERKNRVQSVWPQEKRPAGNGQQGRGKRSG